MSISDDAAKDGTHARLQGISGDEANQHNPGELRVLDALGFGFRRTFSHASLWLVGALVVIVAFAALGALTGVLIPSSPRIHGFIKLGFQIVGNIANILVIFVLPYIFRLATMELDLKNNGWKNLGKDVHQGTALGVIILMVIVWIPFIFVLSILLFGIFVGSIFALSDAAEGTEWTAIVDYTGPWLLLVVLLLVGAFLVVPLFQLMPWYGAEGRGEVMAIFRSGFRRGKEHYTSLLGLNLVLSLIVVILIPLTFGLGLIVLMSVCLLAQAHAFRQIAGKSPHSETGE